MGLLYFFKLLQNSKHAHSVVVYITVVRIAWGDVGGRMHSSRLSGPLPPGLVVRLSFAIGYDRWRGETATGYRARYHVVSTRSAALSGCLTTPASVHLQR